MSELLLIDLSSLVYPLWHIASREPDPDWTSTTAIARVRALATAHKFTAACVDRGRSFRKDIDATYKANRPDKEAPLLHQLRVTEERIAKDGIVALSAAGFEADDIVATAAVMAFQRGLTVTIASSDKDLLQLVDDDCGIQVLSLSSGATYDETAVAVKLGVKPTQVRDYLTLVGDASDNIKGVKGIGEKRAADLLAKFGTLDALTEQIASGQSAEALGLTPAIHLAIASSSDVIAKARELVTLRTDAPIDIATIFEPKPPTEDADTMSELIQQMEPEPAPTTTETTQPAPSTQPVTALATVEPFVGAWERALEPRTARDTMIIAKSLFESRLFSAYGNPNAVAAIIFAGRELGLGMMASLRGFHTVEGKPTMAADLMRSLVLASGKAEYLVCKERTPTQATWITKRKGDPCEVTLAYSLAEAQAAGLVRPNSGWQKHPADMIAKTASSKLCRLVYADVTFGLYSAEELGGDDI